MSNTSSFGRAVKAGVALLASGGAYVLAAAGIKDPTAPSTSKVGEGLTAIGVALVVQTVHSHVAARFLHTVEKDTSRVVTPGVVSRVEKIEATIEPTAAKLALLPAVQAAASVVAGRVDKLEADVRAEAEKPSVTPVVTVAEADIEPVVRKVLASVPLGELLKPVETVADEALPNPIPAPPAGPVSAAAPAV